MVEIYNKIRNTPGKFHGWYNSSAGIIRKQNSFVRFLDSKTKEERIEDSKIKQKTTKSEIRLSWFRKILNWLKVVVRKIINLAR